MGRLVNIFGRERQMPTGLKRLLCCGANGVHRTFSFERDDGGYLDIKMTLDESGGREIDIEKVLAYARHRLCTG